MHINMILRWSASFALLTLYTLHVWGQFSGADTALARTIAGSPVLQNGRHFVLLQENGGRSTIIDQLTRNADESRQLCSVSTEQFRFLAGRSGAMTEQVRVRNRRVPVLTFERDFTPATLGAVLVSGDLPSAHCIAVDAYEQIIWMLSAHLS